MRRFLSENFLLTNDTAIRLYHQYAAICPIVDFHSHLDAGEIAGDTIFGDIGKLWLSQDHYKWRLMRLDGAEERFFSHETTWREKFTRWVEALTKAVGNPLYVWCHLELRRYFGINEILCPKTAPYIYEKCCSMLQTKEFSAKNMLRRMNVKVVCTTNDPTDELRWHKILAADSFDIKVLPTFRPDKARKVVGSDNNASYFDCLSESSNIDIGSFCALVDALQKRHDYFNLNGCRCSDHDIRQLVFEPVRRAEVENIFNKIRKGCEISAYEKACFETALLVELMRMDYESGWVTQLHLGACRNLRTSLYCCYGADCGCDAIGDSISGEHLSRLLDNIDQKKQLPKIILYNINPADTEKLLSIIGSFANGGNPQKIQYGPAWWFCDTRRGILNNIEALSAMALLADSIGMTSDSRSILSFTRHEYYRRILCDFIGSCVERGEIPEEIEMLGSLINKICFNNAIEYFNF